MAITGDYFYINTPLIDTIDLSVFSEQIYRVGIEVKNEFKQLEVFLIPFNGRVRYDLNSIVKSTMPFPEASLDFAMVTIISSVASYTEIRYRFYYLDSNDETQFIEENKAYIFYRGGGINGAVRAPWGTNGILSNSKKIPYFRGYPCANYLPGVNSIVYGFNSIRQVPFAIASDKSVFEEMPMTGRNGAFLFFLNSMAGFSGWYFSNHEITTESAGGVYGFVLDELKDFGSNYSKEIKVFGKVPSRYFGIVEDLITSPLIYLCEKLEGVNNYKWTRLVNEKNTFTDSMKKSEYVDFTFAIPHANRISIR